MFQNRARDVAWGARFADVLSRGIDGEMVVDYTHFDDVVMVEDRPEPARLSAN